LRQSSKCLENKENIYSSCSTEVGELVLYKFLLLRTAAILPCLDDMKYHSFDADNFLSSSYELLASILSLLNLPQLVVLRLSAWIFLRLWFCPRIRWRPALEVPLLICIFLPRLLDIGQLIHHLSLLLLREDVLDKFNAAVRSARDRSLTFKRMSL